MLGVGGTISKHSAAPFTAASLRGRRRRVVGKPQAGPCPPGAAVASPVPLAGFPRESHMATIRVMVAVLIFNHPHYIQFTVRVIL